MKRYNLRDLKTITNDFTQRKKKMPDLARKITTYGIQFNVKAEQPGEKGPVIVEGFIWLTFNLESTFYSCERLRNVLGLFPSSIPSEQTSGVTNIKINNTSALCRLGALGQLKVSLKPVDKNKTFGTLGELHKTSFYFNLNKPITEVAAGLRDVKIKVGESDIEYQVVPASISLKKSKKTTPHF